MGSKRRKRKLAYSSEELLAEWERELLEQKCDHARQVKINGICQGCGATIYSLDGIKYKITE